MTDQLEVIDKVIAEHDYIRRDIKLVRASTSDLEALFSLQHTQSGLMMSSVENLSAKKQQLQQALTQTDAGFKKHFSWEEEALPPLFGETLMRVLIAEHNKINQQVATAQKMVAETSFDGLGQKDMLAAKSHLQQVVSNLSQEIEQHAIIEEHILRWLKKNLEIELAQAE